MSQTFQLCTKILPGSIIFSPSHFPDVPLSHSEISLPSRSFQLYFLFFTVCVCTKCCASLFTSNFPLQCTSPFDIYQDNLAILFHRTYNTQTAFPMNHTSFFPSHRSEFSPRQTENLSRQIGNSPSATQLIPHSYSSSPQIISEEPVNPDLATRGNIKPGSSGKRELEVGDQCRGKKNIESTLLGSHEKRHYCRPS